MLSRTCNTQPDDQDDWSFPSPDAPDGNQKLLVSQQAFSVYTKSLCRTLLDQGRDSPKQIRLDRCGNSNRQEEQRR